MRVRGVSEAYQRRVGGGVGIAACTRHYDVIWGAAIRVYRGVGCEKRFRERGRTGAFIGERRERLLGTIFPVSSNS